jgi:hypothetical protein
MAMNPRTFGVLVMLCVAAVAAPAGCGETAPPSGAPGGPAGPTRADPKRIAALIADLRSEKGQTRRQAAVALGTLGRAAEPAAAALAQALKDPDTGDVAARALGRIGPGAKAAVPALVEALKDGPAPRGVVVEALGKIGPPAAEAVPDLVKALAEEDRVLKAQAIEALGRIGGPGAASALRQVLRDDPDADMAAHAAVMLGEVRPVEDETVSALAAALADTRPAVGQAAAFALGRLGPDAKAAVPDLVKALGSEGPTLRGMAADALGRMGPPAADALAALETAARTRRPARPPESKLQWTESQARTAAAWALYRISGKAQPALGFLVKELESLEAAGDAEAIDVLVRLGEMGPDAAPAAALLERIARTSTVREDRQVMGGPMSARAAATQALRKVRGD